jgi:RNA polymerase sigma-70 factor (ECF subfamily)
VTESAPPDLTVLATGDAETTVRLLERVRSGDSAALDILVARHLVPLRRWAAGRLPTWARDAADTQDLVQETLVRTLRKIEAFEPQHEGAFQAYLRQAVMNGIRDAIRRHGRRGAPEALDSQAEDDRPSPLEQALGRQQTERYERALARLCPGDREAIIGRLEMGYSYDELAAVLGKPSADAARKGAQRALLRLAMELKRDDA